jgi:hypothetical protein
MRFGAQLLPSYWTNYNKKAIFDRTKRPIFLRINPDRYTISEHNNATWDNAIFFDYAGSTPANMTDLLYGIRIVGVIVPSLRRSNRKNPMIPGHIVETLHLDSPLPSQLREGGLAQKNRKEKEEEKKKKEEALAILYDKKSLFYYSARHKTVAWTDIRDRTITRTI